MSDHARTPMSDLVAALASLSDPSKDGKVSAGQRQYRYLELTDLLAEVRTKFGAHGWAIMQQVTVADGAVTVVNLWLHESGEQLAHLPFTLPCGRSPQDVGSSTTYARRYSLAALVGLAGADDDDAQAAQAARRVEPLTRPVERVQSKATDPDPWQEPPPTGPPARPKPLGTGITPEQTKLMWTLLNQTGMTADEIRAYVAAHLSLPSLDWHTKDLSKAQASAIITKLKNDQEGTLQLPPLPPEPDA